MTTWIDGGEWGKQRRKVVDENDCIVCLVDVEQYIGNGLWPWPEGVANFALILQAPKMLEALEAIVALKAPGWCDLGDVLKVYHQHKEIARAAIAAVKGEDDEKG